MKADYGPESALRVHGKSAGARTYKEKNRAELPEEIIVEEGGDRKKGREEMKQPG